MNFVDSLLNKITMYRLVLYILLIWILIGFIYSVFGYFPFKLNTYLFSLVLVILVGYGSNYILAKLYKTPVNIESSLISALILFLIVSPPGKIEDVIFLATISVLVSLGKFVLAVDKKHIFNPVIIALFVGGVIFNKYASWWVGNILLFPYIFIGGFLIVKKTRRLDILIGFIAAVLITSNPSTWTAVIKDATLLFFASVMLIEPLTTPPTRMLRVLYGGLVGILFYNQSAEVALIIGNIFSYLVSPKFRLMLTLKQKTQLTTDTYDFIFGVDKKIQFTPGQYMEFTFDHKNPDSRGNRRYFSLANSPTEKEIRLGIKIDSSPSTYKQNLLELKSNQKIAAGQLMGDFVLPKDVSKKLVLIAGGIGITPYRSMIKYLVDTNQKRDIIIVYTVSNKNNFVYKDVFTIAQNKLGIKTVYVDSHTQGHIDALRLAKEIPDFRERYFYISGSRNVVSGFKEILKDLNIPKNKIITDFFPGFA